RKFRPFKSISLFLLILFCIIQKYSDQRSSVQGKPACQKIFNPGFLPNINKQPFSLISFHNNTLFLYRAIARLSFLREICNGSAHTIPPFIRQKGPLHLSSGPLAFC